MYNVNKAAALHSLITTRYYRKRFICTSCQVWGWSTEQSISSSKRWSCDTFCQIINVKRLNKYFYFTSPFLFILKRTGLYTDIFARSVFRNYLLPNVSVHLRIKILMLETDRIADSSRFAMFMQHFCFHFLPISQTHSIIYFHVRRRNNLHGNAHLRLYI